jgi:uncharacterized membrane protein YeaQ/YmgE (transglycosylase-associated protein family)
MINFIIWIIAGGFIGWLASLIMKTNSRQGTIADIVVGIVGAFVGGYFLSPLFNVSTINESNYSIPALLVSLGGAIILLAISKLFRNVGGFVVIVVIVLLILVYSNCWTMGVSLCVLHQRQGDSISAMTRLSPSGGDEYSPDAGCVWGVFVIIGLMQTLIESANLVVVIYLATRHFFFGH